MELAAWGGQGAGLRYEFLYLNNNDNKGLFYILVGSSIGWNITYHIINGN